MKNTEILEKQLTENIFSGNLEEVKKVINLLSHQTNILDILDKNIIKVLEQKNYDIIKLFIERGVSKGIIDSFINPQDTIYNLGIHLTIKESDKCENNVKDLKNWLDLYYNSDEKKIENEKTSQLINLLENSNLKEEEILAECKKLINDGANIYLKKYDNPLFYACKNGYSLIVDYLITNNANVYAYNFRSICAAAEHGKTNILKYFVDIIKRNDDLKQHLLTISSFHNQLNNVKYIESLGWDDNMSENVLNYASEGNSLDVVEYIIKKDITQKALDYSLELSSKRGFISVVKILVEIGANIDIAIEKSTEDIREWAIKYKEASNLKNNLNEMPINKNKIKTNKI